MNGQTNRAARFVTLVVTNATKIVGLYIGLRTTAQANPQPTVLGFAALCVAGGQLSETLVLGAIERIMGGGSGKSLDKRIERESKSREE